MHFDVTVAEATGRTAIREQRLQHARAILFSCTASAFTLQWADEFAEAARLGFCEHESYLEALNRRWFAHAATDSDYRGRLQLSSMAVAEVNSLEARTRELDLVTPEARERAAIQSLAQQWGTSLRLLALVTVQRYWRLLQAGELGASATRAAIRRDLWLYKEQKRAYEGSAAVVRAKCQRELDQLEAALHTAAISSPDARPDEASAAGDRRQMASVEQAESYGRHAILVYGAHGVRMVRRLYRDDVYRRQRPFFSAEVAERMRTIRAESVERDLLREVIAERLERDELVTFERTHLLYLVARSGFKMEMDVHPPHRQKALHSEQEEGSPSTDELVFEDDGDTDDTTTTVDFEPATTTSPQLLAAANTAASSRQSHRRGHHGGGASPSSSITEPHRRRRSLAPMPLLHLSAANLSLLEGAIQWMERTVFHAESNNAAVAVEGAQPWMTCGGGGGEGAQQPLSHDGWTALWDDAILRATEEEGEEPVGQEASLDVRGVKQEAYDRWIGQPVVHAGGDGHATADSGEPLLPVELCRVMQLRRAVSDAKAAAASSHHTLVESVAHGAAYATLVGTMWDAAASADDPQGHTAISGPSRSASTVQRPASHAGVTSSRSPLLDMWLAALSSQQQPQFPVTSSSQEARADQHSVTLSQPETRTGMTAHGAIDEALTRSVEPQQHSSQGGRRAETASTAPAAFSRATAVSSVVECRTSSSLEETPVAAEVASTPTRAVSTTNSRALTSLSSLSAAAAARRRRALGRRASESVRTGTADGRPETSSVLYQRLSPRSSRAAKDLDDAAVKRTTTGSAMLSVSGLPAFERNAAAGEVEEVSNDATTAVDHDDHAVVAVDDALDRDVYHGVRSANVTCDEDEGEDEGADDEGQHQGDAERGGADELRGGGEPPTFDDDAPLSQFLPVTTAASTTKNNDAEGEEHPQKRMGSKEPPVAGGRSVTPTQPARATSTVTPRRSTTLSRGSHEGPTPNPSPSRSSSSTSGHRHSLMVQTPLALWAFVEREADHIVFRHLVLHEAVDRLAIIDAAFTFLRMESIYFDVMLSARTGIVYDQREEEEEEEEDLGGGRGSSLPHKARLPAVLRQQRIRDVVHRVRSAFVARVEETTTLENVARRHLRFEEDITLLRIVDSTAPILREWHAIHLPRNQTFVDEGNGRCRLGEEEATGRQLVEEQRQVGVAVITTAEHYFARGEDHPVVVGVGRKFTFMDLVRRPTSIGAAVRKLQAWWRWIALAWRFGTPACAGTLTNATSVSHRRRELAAAHAARVANIRQSFDSFLVNVQNLAALRRHLEREPVVEQGLLDRRRQQRKEFPATNANGEVSAAVSATLSHLASAERISRDLVEALERSDRNVMHQQCREITLKVIQLWTNHHHHDANSWIEVSEWTARSRLVGDAAIAWQKDFFGDDGSRSLTATQLPPGSRELAASSIRLDRNVPFFAAFPQLDASAVASAIQQLREKRHTFLEVVATTRVTRWWRRLLGVKQRYRRHVVGRCLWALFRDYVLSPISRAHCWLPPSTDAGGIPFSHFAVAVMRHRLLSIVGSSRMRRQCDVTSAAAASGPASSSLSRSILPLPLKRRTHPGHDEPRDAAQPLPVKEPECVTAGALAAAQLDELWARAMETTGDLSRVYHRVLRPSRVSEAEWVAVSQLFRLPVYNRTPSPRPRGPVRLPSSSSSIAVLPAAAAFLVRQRSRAAQQQRITTHQEVRKLLAKKVGSAAISLGIYDEAAKHFEETESAGRLAIELRSLGDGYFPLLREMEQAERHHDEEIAEPVERMLMHALNHVGCSLARLPGDESRVRRELEIEAALAFGRAWEVRAESELFIVRNRPPAVLFLGPSRAVTLLGVSAPSVTTGVEVDAAASFGCWGLMDATLVLSRTTAAFNRSLTELLVVALAFPARRLALLQQTEDRERLRIDWTWCVTASALHRWFHTQGEAPA